MDSSSNNSNSSNNDYTIITMNKSISSDNIVDSNDRNNSIMSPAEIEPNSGSAKRAAEATATLYRVAARNLRKSQGVNSLTAPMLEKIMTLLQLEPRRLVVQGLAPRRLLLGASPAPLPTMDDSPDVEENERYEERDGIENDTSEAEQMEADEREKEDTSGDGNDDTLEKEDKTQEEPKPKPESRRPIHAALVTGGIKLRPRETKALLRALDVSPHRFVRLGLVDGKTLRAVDDSVGPPHDPHHLCPGHSPGMGKHGHGSRFGRNIGYSGPPPHGRHHSGRHIHLPNSESEGGNGRPMHGPPRHHGPPRGRHGGGRRGHSGPPPHGRHHSGRHLHLSGSDSEGGYGRPMHGPPRHHGPPRGQHGSGRRGHSGPPPHGRHHPGRHLHLSGSDSEGEYGRPMHGPPHHQGPPRDRHGGGRRGEHSGPPPHGRHHSGRHLHLSGSDSEGEYGRPMHSPSRHHGSPRGRHGGGRRGEHSGPPPHGRHHSGRHLHLPSSDSEGEYGKPMHGPPRHHGPPRGRHGGGRRGEHSGPPPHGRHHSGRHLHLSGSDSEGEYDRPMHGLPRHHGPPRGRHGGGRRGHSGPPPHGRHHSGRHLYLPSSDSEGKYDRPMHGPPRHHGPPRGRHGGGRRGHSGPPPHGRHHSSRHLHLSGSDSEGEYGRPMHGPPRQHDPPRGRHGGGRRGEHFGPPPHGRHHSGHHLHLPSSDSEGEYGRPMHGPPRHHGPPHGRHHSGRHLHLRSSDSEGEYGRPMHGPPRHHGPPRGRHGGGRRGHSGPPPHGRHHSGRHLHLSGNESEGEYGRPMHGPPRHHGPPRGRHGGGRRGHSGPPPHGRHHSGRHLHLSGSDSEGEYDRPMHGPPRHHGPPRGRHGGGRRGHSGRPPHGQHHSGRHLHLPSSDCEGDSGRPMHGPSCHHGPPRGRYGGGRRGHSGPSPHGRHLFGRHLHPSGSDSEGEYGRPMYGPPRHHGPPRDRHGGGKRGEHSGPPPHGRHHPGRHLHLPSSDSEGEYGRPMHGPPRHHGPPRGRHGGGRRGHSGPPPHGRHHSSRHLHLSGSDSEGEYGRPMHGPPRHHGPPRGRHGGGKRGEHSGPSPHGRHHSGRHLHLPSSDSEGEYGRPMHGPPSHHGPPRGRHGGGRRGHSGPPPHGRHHSGRHLLLSGSDSEGEYDRPMHDPPRHHGPPRGRHGGGRRGHSGPPPHVRHHSGRHLHLSGSDSEWKYDRPMHGPPRHHGPPRGRHGGGRRGHSGPPPHGRHHSSRHLHLPSSDSEGEYCRPMHGPPRHHDPACGRHGGGRRGEHSGPPPHGRHHSGRHLHL